MSKRLTEDEIKMLKDLVEEMKREASDKLSLEENMQISLAARVENINEQKEVADICKGIRRFDELLEQMKEENGKELILETIMDSELRNKSVEEQYAILAESLEALKADLTGSDYDLGELKDLKIEKDEGITEEKLGAIKEMLAEYLDQFALLHGETEAMEHFFQSIGGKVSEELLHIYENENEKYYTALAIDILQLQGRLEAVPPETGAEGIGVNVAASIASAKVHIKKILGKISSEDVVKALKKIAKAALTIMVGLAIGAAAYVVGNIVFFITTIIFGYGMIGMITALVFTAGSAIMTISGLCEIWEDVQEFMGKAKECASEKAEVVRKWITEKALPALKLFWERLKEKVSCFISGCPESVQEEDDFFENHEAVNDIAVEA